MNIIQERLVLLARTIDLEKTRRVDLVKMIGCEYPSQITYHIDQLKKRGDLVKIGDKLVPAIKTIAGYITIPVMGEADCGEATKFADGTLMDRLVISPSVLPIKRPDRVYALIARGDSMNDVCINNKTIDDGDYVIVEKNDAYEPVSGDIVVSVIGGLANIKRFRREPDRIVLYSESKHRDTYLPIIIHPGDDYSVDGKVVEVIKAVQV